MSNTDRFIINKDAADFNIKALPILKAIADPLLKHTGLTHFTYNRFIQGNRFMALTSEVETALTFLENDLDRYLLFENLLIPKNSKRVVYWDLQPVNDLIANLRYHNFSHGLSIFIRGENEIEAWHFATSIENSQINQFYLNHPDVIDQYIIHFKDRARDLICCSDSSKLAMYSENRSLNLEEDKDTSKILALKELMRVRQRAFTVDGKDIFLSRREYETIMVLSKGFRVKSIARQMDLSPRTVEENINRVKTKLGVPSVDGILKIIHESVYPLLET